MRSPVCRQSPRRAPRGATRSRRASRLHIGSYRPAREAGKIRCPILFCVADNDDLTPPGPVLKAANKAPRAEVKRYPIGHFDIYIGEWFERAVADQTDFLKRHLLGGYASSPTPAETQP